MVRSIDMSTLAAAALLACTIIPGPGVTAADAYMAELAWRHAPGAEGYRVYVRLGEDSRELSVDVGSIAPDGEDEATYTLHRLPVGPPTYFSVATYDSDGIEGDRSNEIAIDYATSAAFSDSDGDGLSDAAEDADLDGEVDPGESDPRNVDTDGDGLTDGDEIEIFGTSPVDNDSDGDGYTDAEEVEGGTDPTSRHSYLDRCGDADADGRLTLSDVLTILYIATTFDSTLCITDRCDTSGNGSITVTDARIVMLNLFGTFEMRCEELA